MKVVSELIEIYQRLERLCDMCGCAQCRSFKATAKQIMQGAEAQVGPKDQVVPTPAANVPFPDMLPFKTCDVKNLLNMLNELFLQMEEADRLIGEARSKAWLIDEWIKKTIPGAVIDGVKNKP